MNDLLAEQAKLFEKVSSAMGNAANASQQMKNSTEQQTQEQTNNVNMGPQVVENLKAQTDGANALAEALGRGSTSIEDNSNQTSSWIDRLAKGVTAGGLFMTAINSIGQSLDMVGGAFSLAKGAASGLLGIFGAGIKTVTGFFTGLMSAAADWYNKAGPAMFQANQDIVKSFGNLDESQGKFVKGLVKDLGPAQNALKKSSSSLFAIIGNGAEVLKAVTALAGEFGDDLVYLQDQIKGAVPELLMMQKGMGLTGDAMKNLGSTAAASGGTLQESLEEGMVASAHLSKKFGVDVKVIGKGLNEMAADMKTFGHLGTKEMAAVATYTAKLGVEMSALKGIMDKFDSFEGAAEAAGKLNEAFGMNIDTMKMMNAENPAERMDMLRQSLQETGKSFEELSRHEKKLMADTMGMDMKSLQNAMSVDVDEMGFDDFGDAAEEAAEKMTPEQAMQDVAKSIEKLSHTLNKLSSGPLSNFIEGFMRIIDRSPMMQKLMKKISSFLKVFTKMGEKVGHIFLKFMKTNDGLLKQIHSLFDLKRITKFKDAVTAAFGKFFDLLATDPKAAMEGLWDDIVSAIKSWAGDTADGAAGIKDTLFSMLEGGIKLLHGLVPKLMEEMAKGLVYITEALRDFLEKPNDATTAITDGVGGAMQAALESIGDVWGDKLWPAIKDLFELLWEKASPYVYKVLWFGIKVIFVKALIQSLAALAAGGMVKVIGGLIAKFFGKAIQEGEKQTPGKGDTGGANMFKKLRETLSEIGKIKIMDVVKAGASIAIMAFFFGVSMVGLAYAILEASKPLKQVAWKDFAKLLGMVGTAIAATIGLTKIAKGLQPGAMVNAGLGLVAGAIFFGVSVGAFALAIKLINYILEGVPFMGFMKQLVMVGAAVVATGILSLAGAAFFASIVSTGVILASAGGMLAGALFFGVSVAAYAKAIQLVTPILAGTKFLDVIKLFALVGSAIVATGALVVAGVVLGNPIALASMLLAAAGLSAGALLLTGALTKFARALGKGLNAFAKMNLSDVSSMMESIVLAIMAIIGLTVVGPAFAAGGFFGLDKIIAKGVGVMASIAEKSFPRLSNVIREIEKIPITDPEMFAKRMEGIAGVMTAVQGLANLGLEAGKMGMMASLFSDDSPSDMMFAMEMFIVNTVDSISNMITGFVTLAKGLTKEDLEKIGAVAGIISAVSDLASGMLAPFSDIIKNQSAYAIYKGEGPSKQMAEMAAGMGGILLRLAIYLPMIINSLKASTESITDPEAFKKKSEALGGLFTGLAKIMEAIGKLYFNAQKAGKGYFTDDSAETVLNDMFATMWRLFLPGGIFRQMVHAAAGALKEFKFPEGAQIENFSKGMDAIMRTIDKMVKFGEGFDAKNQLLTKMGNLIAKWSTTYWAPHEIVEMLVQEAKDIATAMNNLQLDMESFNLAPMLGDVIGLGKKGTQEFTIKPKGVNITVNFNVTMDAEALATQIVKGNKKNKKEGFFVLTEAAKNAELEGSRGTAGG